MTPEERSSIVQGTEVVYEGHPGYWVVEVLPWGSTAGRLRRPDKKKEKQAFQWGPWLRLATPEDKKKTQRISRGVRRLQLESEGVVPNYKESEKYKEEGGPWSPEEGALERWDPYFLAHARLRITSSHPAKTAQECGLEEEYVEPCAETTHGAKFDIVVTDCLELASAPADLHLFFNSEGHSCRIPMEVQIGCREFAEHLMKRGLVPEVSPVL